MDNVMPYAQVEQGIVTNIISWDGNRDVDAGGWIPPEDAIMVQLVADQAASIGYPAMQAEGGTWTFAAPTLPQAPVLTANEILIANTQHRDDLLGRATLAIAPLQDAVDLDEATAEETALLKQWKQFRVATNRIDLTVVTPAWPVAPQTGYGAAVTPVTAAS